MTQSLPVAQMQHCSCNLESHLTRSLQAMHALAAFENLMVHAVDPALPIAVLQEIEAMGTSDCML